MSKGRVPIAVNRLDCVASWDVAVCRVIALWILDNSLSVLLGPRIFDMGWRYKLVTPKWWRCMQTSSTPIEVGLPTTTTPSLINAFGVVYNNQSRKVPLETCSVVHCNQSRKVSQISKYLEFVELWDDRPQQLKKLRSRARWPQSGPVADLGGGVGGMHPPPPA